MLFFHIHFPLFYFHISAGCFTVNSLVSFLLSLQSFCLLFCYSPCPGPYLSVLTSYAATVGGLYLKEMIFYWCPKNPWNLVFSDLKCLIREAVRCQIIRQEASCHATPPPQPIRHLLRHWLRLLLFTSNNQRVGNDKGQKKLYTKTDYVDNYCMNAVVMNIMKHALCESPKFCCDFQNLV